MKNGSYKDSLQKFCQKRAFSIFKGYFKKLKTLYQKSAVVRFLEIT